MVYFLSDFPMYIWQFVFHNYAHTIHISVSIMLIKYDISRPKGMNYSEPPFLCDPQPNSSAF